MELRVRNRVLRELGYIEARDKPFLFYRTLVVQYEGKETNCVHFADMRAKKYARRFGPSLPIFYSKFDDSIPSWFCTRVENSEIEILHSRSIPLTLYVSGTMMVNAGEVSEYMEWCEEGYCKICKENFLEQGNLCKECSIQELADVIESLPECDVCGKKLIQSDSDVIIYREPMVSYSYARYTQQELTSAHERYGLPDVRRLARHHIDYTNDITIPVCYSCHGKITARKDESLSKYWPKDSPKDRKRYKYVNCFDCSGRTRVPIGFTYKPPRKSDPSPDGTVQLTLDDGTPILIVQKPPLCYKCKRKRNDRIIAKLNKVRFG